MADQPPRRKRPGLGPDDVPDEDLDEHGPADSETSDEGPDVIPEDVTVERELPQDRRRQDD